MSQGIHCDTVVVLANSNPFKIRNLVDKLGTWTNTYDIRTLSSCPGYILKCTESLVNTYLSVTLEDDSRFLITPEYRVLTDSNTLIQARKLKKNCRLKLGRVSVLNPQYDDRTIQTFVRETFKDSDRLDKLFLEYEHVSDEQSVAVKLVREIKSSNAVPFFDLRIPKFHTFAIKVGTNLIYVHR